MWNLVHCNFVYVYPRSFLTCQSFENCPFPAPLYSRTCTINHGYISGRWRRDWMLFRNHQYQSSKSGKADCSQPQNLFFRSCSNSSTSGHTTSRNIPTRPAWEACGPWVTAIIVCTRSALHKRERGSLRLSDLDMVTQQINGIEENRTWVSRLPTLFSGD